MNYQFLSINPLSDQIILTMLNRPEKRNALNIAMIEELFSFIQKIENEASYRVLIISGKGAAFCSGLDLREAVDPNLIETHAKAISSLFTKLYKCKLVTIAAVQGDAAAGGAGIVAACDFAIMASQARMGFPEARRGLVAAFAATLLVRQMRMRDIRELLLTGEYVSSQRAYEMGLVNRVVEAEHLLSESLSLSNSILEGGPEAIKATKHLIMQLEPSNFDDDMKQTFIFHNAGRHSKEADEGIAAFLNKKQPSWFPN